MTSTNTRWFQCKPEWLWLVQFKEWAAAPWKELLPCMRPWVPPPHHLCPSTTELVKAEILKLLRQFSGLAFLTHKPDAQSMKTHVGEERKVILWPPYRSWPIIVILKLKTRSEWVYWNYTWGAEIMPQLKLKWSTTQMKTEVWIPGNPHKYQVGTEATCNSSPRRHRQGFPEQAG